MPLPGGEHPKNKQITKMLSHVTCSSLPLLQTVREKVNVTNCSRDPHTQLECHNSQQTSQPPLFSHFHKFHRVSCMTFSKHQHHRWTAAGSLLVAHVTMIHDLKKKNVSRIQTGHTLPPDVQFPSPHHASPLHRDVPPHDP